MHALEAMEHDCRVAWNMYNAERAGHAPSSIQAIAGPAQQVSAERHIALAGKTSSLLSTFIEVCLAEAGKQVLPDEALAVLDRAEKWSDVLEAVVRGRDERVVGSSPVDSVTSGRVSPVSAMFTGAGASALSLLTVVNATILKERVYSMTRDAATLRENWQLAIKYAKRAHRTAEAISAVVHSVMQRDYRSDALRGMALVSEGPFVGETEFLEFERLATQFHPIRSAKNMMNLCVLISRLKRHHDAAQYASDAVNILRPIVLHGSSMIWFEHAGGDDVDPVDRDPKALLAAALFNLGSQLELCKRGQEAMAAFDEALDLADAHLGKKHPLTKELRQIVLRAAATRSPLVEGHLPAVACTMTQTYFVAGGASDAHVASRGRLDAPRGFTPASSRGGASRLSDNTPTGTAARPPSQRAASLSSANTRRVSTAPSSQERPQGGPAGPKPPPGRPAAGRAARSEARDDVTLFSSGASIPRGLPRASASRPAQLDPIPHAASHRSHSSPMKHGGGWLATGDVDQPECKTFAPPAAVLDLSEALREEERARFVPTTERLGVGGRQRALPSSTAVPTRLQLVAVEHRPVVADTYGGAERAESAASSEKGRSSSRQLSGAAAPGSSFRRSNMHKSSVTAKSSRSLTEAQHQPPVLTQQEIEAQREGQLLQWITSVTDKQFSEYGRRFRAALTIQCAWRCSRARLEYFNRQQVLYCCMYHEQRAAAACISSNYKAWCDRRRLQLLLKARRLRVAQRAESERKQAAAASKIVKAARCFLRDTRHKRDMLRKLRLKQESKLQLYESASVMVQRWWRIVRVQKAYWRRRRAEIAEERQRQIAEARFTTAATEIQRIVRGVQGRRYAAEYRRRRRTEEREWQRKIVECTDAVRTFLQEVRMRKQRLALLPEIEAKTKSNAAAKIQEGWQQSLHRRALHQNNARCRAVRLAALRIQRCYRCYRARRELRLLRTISRATQLVRVEREFRQSRAAVRIQSVVRKFLSRRRMSQAKAKFGRRIFLSTLHLQRVCRGFQSRHTFAIESAMLKELAEGAMQYALGERHRLASLVQSFAAAYYSRAYRAALQDAADREELLVSRRARREIVEDEAATRIQSVVRMRHAKEAVKQRRDDLSLDCAAVMSSIIRLQCFFRVVAAKRRLGRLRVQVARRRQQQQLDALVALEVFQSRASELDTIEALERCHLEGLEASAWSQLLTGGDIGADDESSGLYDD